MEAVKPGALGSGPPQGTVPQSIPGIAGTSASAAEQRLQAAVAAVADQLEISALDVPAALRILIAEVRQAVAADSPELLLPSPPALAAMLVSPSTAATAATPGAASASLLAMFLAAAPAAAQDAGAWMEAVARLEQAFLAGHDRAAAIITAWRGVTPEVLSFVHASQTLFTAALTNAREPDVAVRAEWLEVAPRLQRFRRRRRALQRRLEDPDHRTPQVLEDHALGEPTQD